MSESQAGPEGLMEEKFVVSGPGNTAVDRAANRIGHEGTLRTLASAAGHQGVVKVCDCNADCSRVDRGRVTRGEKFRKAELVKRRYALTRRSLRREMSAVSSPSIHTPGIDQRPLE